MNREMSEEEVTSLKRIEDSKYDSGDISNLIRYVNQTGDVENIINIIMHNKKETTTALYILSEAGPPAIRAKDHMYPFLLDSKLDRRLFAVTSLLNFAKAGDEIPNELRNLCFDTNDLIRERAIKVCQIAAQ